MMTATFEPSGGEPSCSAGGATASGANTDGLPALLAARGSAGTGSSAAALQVNAHHNTSVSGGSSFTSSAGSTSLPVAEVSFSDIVSAVLAVHHRIQATPDRQAIMAALPSHPPALPATLAAALTLKLLPAAPKSSHLPGGQQ